MGQVSMDWVNKWREHDQQLMPGKHHVKREIHPFKEANKKKRGVANYFD
jgi:hypothetical protein